MKLKELLLFAIPTLLILLFTNVFGDSLGRILIVLFAVFILVRIWNKPESRERRKKLHGDDSFISFLKRLFKSN